MEAHLEGRPEDIEVIREMPGERAFWPSAYTWFLLYGQQFGDHRTGEEQTLGL
jgi:hypothetical protein